MQIGNKGLVSFGKRNKGKHFRVDASKKMFCAFCSNIDAPGANSGKCASGGPLEAEISVYNSQILICI